MESNEVLQINSVLQEDNGTYMISIKQNVTGQGLLSTSTVISLNVLGKLNCVHGTSLKYNYYIFFFQSLLLSI